MNRKFITITVILSLALVVFLYGKEKQWWKPKATPAEEEPKVGNEPGVGPVGPKGSTTNPTTNTQPKGNTGTGTVPAPKTTPAYFDAKDQAIKLSVLLKDFWDPNDEDEKAFDMILSYSTAQLQAVDKAWREVYPTKARNLTLYRMVDTEVVLGASRATVREKKLKVLKRMKDLGLDKI